MTTKVTKLVFPLRNEYQQLYDNLEITKSKQKEVDTVVNRIIANKSRYEYVSGFVGIPWYFIAIVHNMEGSGNFKTHLHNGDPLTARTVQVPKGRPKNGSSPFTWEESAIDALEYEGFKNANCWSLSAILYRFEKYNGWGYRNKCGINSPYLWSYSQHYTKGKYVADGHFDPNAVSKQIGAVILLKQLSKTASLGIKIEDEPEITMPNLWKIKCDPNNVNPEATNLQLLLNRFDYKLNPDGKAGQLTSNAVFDFTGKYLSNK